MSDIRASLRSEPPSPPPQPRLRDKALGLVFVLLVIVGGWHALGWVGGLIFGSAPERTSTPDKSVAVGEANIRDPRRTVEFAPEGEDVEVGRAFDEDRGVREAYKNLRKSKSGYPIVVSLRAVPVCISPFQIHEVEDAWRAKNIDWINKLPGCGMIPAGSFMEWTRYFESIGPNKYRQFRIIADDGVRATFYGPAMDPEEKMWFGWYEIKK